MTHKDNSTDRSVFRVVSIVTGQPRTLKSKFEALSTDQLELFRSRSACDFAVVTLGPFDGVDTVRISGGGLLPVPPPHTVSATPGAAAQHFTGMDGLEAQVGAAIGRLPLETPTVSQGEVASAMIAAMPLMEFVTKWGFDGSVLPPEEMLCCSRGCLLLNLCLCRNYIKLLHLEAKGLKDAVSGAKTNTLNRIPMRNGSGAQRKTRGLVLRSAVKGEGLVVSDGMECTTRKYRPIARDPRLSANDAHKKRRTFLLEKCAMLQNDHGMCVAGVRTLLCMSGFDMYGGGLDAMVKQVAAEANAPALPDLTNARESYVSHEHNDMATLKEILSIRLGPMS